MPTLSTSIPGTETTSKTKWNLNDENPNVEENRKLEILDEVGETGVPAAVYQVREKAVEHQNIGKHGFKIDDSLDVFAVHGVGGILGSLLLALFVSENLGGTGYAEGMTFV